MPFTRPDEISNGISLSDKLAAFVEALVDEDCTVNSGLSAIVNELSPNEHGIAFEGSEDDVFARADELPDTPVSIFR